MNVKKRWSIQQEKITICFFFIYKERNGFMMLDLVWHKAKITRHLVIELKSQACKSRLTDEAPKKKLFSQVSDSYCS